MSPEPEHPEPPTGEPPPAWASGPDGTPIALMPFVQAACDAYLAETPQYTECYGDPGRQWLIHDYLHVLRWAMTLPTQERLEREMAWLARVLEARDFPLPWLARGIEVLGETVQGQADLGAAGPRILAAAQFLRSRRSFLAHPENPRPPAETR